MWEANLTFKREEREGVIPVGSYLSDAAGRLGIRNEKKCVPFENVHFCRVSVLEGRDLLSPPTAQETEILAAEPGAAEDERLACQAKITGAGEIVVMSPKKKDEAKDPEAEAAAASEKYTKDFADLPLEKKIAQLAQLEAMALGETVSFVINSPFLIFDKVMDVMAEFGLKKEEESKKAARPAEHAADSDDAIPASEPESAESKKGAEAPPSA